MGIRQINIAGYVAPRLRSQTARRVMITDKDGNTIGETDSHTLAKGILRRVGIELDVQPDEKRTHSQCKCGKIFTVNKTRGNVRLKCRDCSKERVHLTCTKCKRTYRLTKERAETRGTRSLSHKAGAYCDECRMKAKRRYAERAEYLREAARARRAKIKESNS